MTRDRAPTVFDKAALERLLGELRECLEAEHVAIRERAHTSVAELSETKGALIGAIERMGGTSVEDPGIHRLLTECRHKNEVNGSLIRLRRREAERVLDAITGTAAEDRLYDAFGSSESGRRTGSLGEA
ncbi:MAG: hypothetical protein AAF515_16075 [Pseudomonadota bacterium]